LETQLSPPVPTTNSLDPRYDNTISAQLSSAQAAHSSLAQLRATLRAQIDLASLIYRPEELYESEKAWVEAVTHENGIRQAEKRSRTEDDSKPADAGTMSDTNDDEGTSKSQVATDFPVDTVLKGVEDEKAKPGVVDSLESLQRVIDYVGKAMLELDKRIRDGETVTTAAIHRTLQDIEFESESIEDPMIKRLRLNLLALAMRTPLDTVTKIPKHIRY
jgi:bromodomain-containing protein 7/9